MAGCVSFLRLSPIHCINIINIITDITDIRKSKRFKSTQMHGLPAT